MKTLQEHMIAESRLASRDIKKYENIAGIDQSVKQWYHENFKTDSAWEDINNESTFFDILKCLFDKNDIYELIGEDSIVRERVFNGLCKLIGCRYKDIYDMWEEEYYK